MEENPYKAPVRFKAKRLPLDAPLTPRTLFRIVVASIGVWTLFDGCRYLLSAAVCIAGLTAAEDGSSPQAYTVIGAVEIVFGFLALSGLLPFEALAFPHYRVDETEEANDENGRPPEEGKPAA
jgi:hypothetical protein